jgi:hypothetical protein
MEQGLCELSKNWSRTFDNNGEPLNDYDYDYDYGYCDSYIPCIKEIKPKHIKKNKNILKKEPHKYEYIDIELSENIYFKMLEICVNEHITIENFLNNAINNEMRKTIK